MSTVNASISDTISFSGKGATSRRMIDIQVTRKAPGYGIIFELTDKSGKTVLVPATAANVVNTLRNVVVGAGETRLCIVEHFLSAAAVWGLEDLHVKVDGPEMPLDDGSAQCWIDLFAKAGWEQRIIQSTLELKEPIMIQKDDRSLMAIPDSSFSVTYLMDWNHPAIGKRWSSWKPAHGWKELMPARTFATLQEHQLLGLADESVSLTADGFTKPLHWDDEPVRHKLLDLIGDLVLAGVSPLSWKARFISIKGGHEMDVRLAERLAALVR